MRFPGVGPGGLEGLGTPFAVPWTRRERRRRRRRTRRRRMRRTNTSHSCSVCYFLFFVGLLGCVLVLGPPPGVHG